jgi:hypothetical protein
MSEQEEPDIPEEDFQPQLPEEDFTKFNQLFSLSAAKTIEEFNLSESGRMVDWMTHSSRKSKPVEFDVDDVIDYLADEEEEVESASGMMYRNPPRSNEEMNLSVPEIDYDPSSTTQSKEAKKKIIII